MQLMTLDDTWYPDRVIENYTSLIWTERFRLAGDFELKTSRIQDTMNLMPLGSPICIEESSEVFLVENFLIEANDEGKSVLTVSGRSFETFFENRVARPYGDATRSALPLYNSADNSNDWVFDGTYFGDACTTSAELMAYWAETNNADSELQHPMPIGVTIPYYYVNGSLTLVANPPIRRRTLTIKPGNVYENVLSLLALDNLGVSNTRPTAGIDIMTGNLKAREDLSTIIVQGFDRTEKIVFSTAAGHFKSTSHLLSIKNWKNAAWTFSHYNMATQYNTQGPTASGLNRRVGFVDATDIKSSYPGSGDIARLNTRGNAYLARNKRDKIFQGNVADDVPYKFERDYGMGDLVTIVGDYGFKEEMQVVEYIRVEDESGEKGYPTFEIPPEIELVT